MCIRDRAYAILLSITFVELLIGFSLLRVDYALLIALLTAIVAVSYTPLDVYTRQALALLDERQATVLRGRFYEGRTLESLAVQLEMCIRDRLQPVDKSLYHVWAQLR